MSSTSTPHCCKGDVATSPCRASRHAARVWTQRAVNDFWNVEAALANHSLRSLVNWTGAWTPCEYRRRCARKGRLVFNCTGPAGEVANCNGRVRMRDGCASMLIVGSIPRASTESRLRLCCLEAGTLIVWEWWARFIDRGTRRGGCLFTD